MIFCSILDVAAFVGTAKTIFALQKKSENPSFITFTTQLLSIPLFLQI